MHRSNRDLPPCLAGFARRENGMMSVWGLYMAVGILFVGGLGIDAVNAFMVRHRLQVTADIAALAASRELPNQPAAQARAIEYMEKNLDASLYGNAADYAEIDFGLWDEELRTFSPNTAFPDAIRITLNKREALGGRISPILLGLVGFSGFETGASVVSNYSARSTCTAAAVDLGGLTDYLMVIADGSQDANWQGSSPGFAGDVAVNGGAAALRNSGTMPYAGSIVTDAHDLGPWQDIVDQNAAAASAVTGQSALIQDLRDDLDAAIAHVTALQATPGFQSVSPLGMDNWNVQNGVADVFVVNVTSDLNLGQTWDIWGDADDLFIMRWDVSPGDGLYHGEVTFSNGGGIVPHGGLTPANFVHVAGKIDAKGGGTTPAALEPYLAALPGSVVGGGFFTGYWLTTGDPSDSFKGSNFDDAVIVGGWYTRATSVNLTSGSSGAHVAPVLGTGGTPCAPSDMQTSITARLLH